MDKREYGTSPISVYDSNAFILIGIPHDSRGLLTKSKGVNSKSGNILIIATS